MGSVHARGDTFLTFGLKALTETNTSRLATGATTLLDPLERASLNHYQSLALSNGPNRISAPIILSEVGNRSSFRNVVFTETDDGQSPKTRFLEIMYFVTC
jgi:hypothetical protein